MVVSVRDILTFHKLDRRVFHKIMAVGRAPEIAQNILALYMWLELIGIDVITCIMECNNLSTILQFVIEAEFILDCLRLDVQPPPSSKLVIPFIAALVTKPIDLGFFYSNKNIIVRGLVHILDCVGTLIFDDRLYAVLHGYEVAVRVTEETKRLGVQAALPELPQELARPYNYRAVQTPQDQRSMIVTIFQGFPLRREDIIEYFMQKWDGCIETVVMEMASPSGTSMYGRIVFTSESYIQLVLNGEQAVKFMIRGRDLWFGRCVPRNR